MTFHASPLSRITLRLFIWYLLFSFKCDLSWEGFPNPFKECEVLFPLFHWSWDAILSYCFLTILDLFSSDCEILEDRVYILFTSDLQYLAQNLSCIWHSTFYWKLNKQINTCSNIKTDAERNFPPQFLFTVVLSNSLWYRTMFKMSNLMQICTFVNTIKIKYWKNDWIHVRLLSKFPNAYSWFLYLSPWRQVNTSWSVDSALDSTVALLDYFIDSKYLLSSLVYQAMFEVEDIEQWTRQTNIWL